MQAARPPVILQVVPSLDAGGVERGTVEMAAAIAEAGGVALVASAGGRLEPAVEHVGGRNILLPLASKFPWTGWRNAARLERVIRDESVQIVHARSRAPAWSALLACQRTGAHFVTTYHAPYGEDFPGKRRYNAVMAAGERVIAISRFIAGEVVRRHGVDPARVRTIHRGVDPAVFDPDGVSYDRIRRQAAAWRLQDDHEAILLPARLTRWKGHAVLIEAMARMQRGDVTAVLLGSDRGRAAYARELAALAERLGVAGQVRMVGHCDDMPAALALAAVVVNASTEPEGFGRVIVEAQAMARPVVASDHGGAMETIEHDSTGWLVPPGDPAALAAMLDFVLALPPEYRAAFGARARASVAGQFTVRAMQQATLAVYAEVLSR
jgi:glycosyltransferase involved in cell wall biosynthesis